MSLKTSPIYLLVAGLFIITVAQADDVAPSTRDFRAVDAALTRHSSIPYTGNADMDYRIHLIARREDIINMSEVALSRASDPKTAQLAQQTIASQNRDIAELKEWLKAHKG